MSSPRVNPVLKELGFGPGDRAIVVHADDVGMCRSTIPAFEDLLEAGPVSSGSVMVPSRLFPDVVSWRKRHSELDVGIHLTLNSEWTNCRWRPVTSAPPGSGLTDVSGYFHRSHHTLRQRAAPAAVKLEMQGQLERARTAGMEPTHYDSHMYAALCSRFFPDYIGLGDRADIVAFIPRRPPRAWRDDRDLPDLIAGCERVGRPIFDHVLSLGLSDPRENTADRVVDLVRGLPPGLTYFPIHPARDDPELRAIATDWRCRVRDYRAFLSADVRRCLHDFGIQPLSFGAIGAAGGRLRRASARPAP